MTASAAAASAAAVVAPVIGDAAVVAAIPTPHANGSVSMTGDYYFDSYSHYGIHMEMLKDSHRTGSYRDAILMNPQLFRGKTVLDVGCGTGILSMFAAKAGAKKVIAVDCSSIAHQAREIVKLNGFSDVITVLHGKLEELPWPEGVGKVDIIISEWMGYFLLYESMLQSVLYARDKYGAEDVKLLPSHANMFITGISDVQYVEDRFDVWNDIEGFDFSYCRRLCYIEPLVDTASREQIVTTCETLVEFDLAKVKEEELSFKSDVTLVATRDETIHALEVHFDTPFEAGHERVNLETAPWTQTTHWRQSMLYLVNPLRVAKGDRIRVNLTCAPNADNKRDLDIHVRVDMDGTYQISHFDQDFRMR